MMGDILRIGFRQLEAIKKQVVFGLASSMAAKPSFSLKDWIQEYEPDLCSHYPKDGDFGSCSTSHKGSTLNYVPALDILISDFEESGRKDPCMERYVAESGKRTSGSAHFDADILGSQRGGGWSVENFILRSGLMLALGVQEAFERDVIRILDSYVDPSIATGSNRDTIRPTTDDVQTETSSKSKSEDQRRMGKCSDRRRILSEYKVDSRLPEKQAELLLDAWYDRNHLAHGYRIVDVEISLTTFLKVHHHVFFAINHLSDQCLNKHNIEI